MRTHQDRLRRYGFALLTLALTAAVMAIPDDPGRGGDPDPRLLLRRPALGLVRRPRAGAVDHRRDRR